MELNGEKRQKIGKAVKSLRKDGLIPAVVFGNEIESTAVVIKLNDFTKLFSEVGETSLIDLKFDGENYKVLVNQVQHDPITGKVIHVGFYKPNLKERTEVEIPVELIGEEKNPLVKSGDGVILQLMNEIRVSALPTELPESFEIDVSTLTEIGTSVSIGQLNYDREKIEIVDYEEDELVVKIDAAQMPEEETESVTEAEAIEKMEAIAEKKEEEEGEDADKK